MKLGRAVLCGPTTTLLLLFLSLSYLSCSAYGQVPAPAPAPISAEEGPLVEEETELDPFTGIQICLPYNVLVAPSTGNYSISIQSSLDVLAALNTTIADDTLQLQTDGDFVTDQPIKLTVLNPAQTQIHDHCQHACRCNQRLCTTCDQLVQPLAMGLAHMYVDVTVADEPLIPAR